MALEEVADVTWRSYEDDTGWRAELWAHSESAQKWFRAKHKDGTLLDIRLGLYAYRASHSGVGVVQILDDDTPKPRSKSNLRGRGKHITGKGK